jgi:hypothetical protein
MPRRKQARRTTVKDIRSILRLTHEQGLSVRAVSERLKISKTSVATYLLRAKETGLSVWPLPPGLDDDARLSGIFSGACRPTAARSESSRIGGDSAELKRKGVTLTLLWQEYRASPSRRLRLHLVLRHVLRSSSAALERNIPQPS